MYNVELKGLTLQNAQTKILQTVEDICDQFHIENDFGTISSATNNLLSLMERYSDDQDATFTINFFVDSKKVSIQLLNYDHLKDVQRAFETCSLNDSDTEAFTAKTLIDNFEFSEEGLWMEIVAASLVEQPDRAQILHHETVTKKQHIQ